jgi:DNA-binding GntR family transcriptional regulator
LAEVRRPRVAGPPAAGQTTTANRIAETLAGRVLQGDYPPGTSLREVALAAELGIGRSTLREALRILERDGVVRIEPHRGASVTQLSTEELIEIYQVRTVLLGLAMALSAQRRTDRDLQTLERLYARMARAVDDPRAGESGLHARLSAEMALKIMDCAGNQKLRDLLTQMAHQIARYTRLGLSTSLRRQRSADTWRKVLDALAARDSTTAERLGRQLVTETLRHALGRIAAIDREDGL